MKEDDWPRPPPWEEPKGEEDTVDRLDVGGASGCCGQEMAEGLDHAATTLRHPELLQVDTCSVSVGPEGDQRGTRETAPPLADSISVFVRRSDQHPGVKLFVVLSVCSLPEPQQQRQTTESSRAPASGEGPAAAARPPSGQPGEAASSPPPPNSL